MLIIIITLILPGCQFEFKTTLEHLEDVSVVGVDEQDGQIKLTIITQLVESGGDEQTGKTQQVAIYTSEGQTDLEAVRKFHAYTNKDIFWGHTDYIIIGEETAKKGVGSVIDFFIRNHEHRMMSKIVIAQNATAEEFIKKTNLPQVSLSDRLESLFSDVGAMSQSSEVTLIDYLDMVNEAWHRLYLPCVQMVDHMVKEGEDTKYLDVQLDGYAIFDDDKLTGIANGKMARGISFVKNDVVTGVIVGKAKGEKVSLEIISSDCEIETELKGNVPSAKIKLTFTTNIAEYQGTEDIFHEDIIRDLVDQQDRFIKKEIEKSIAFLQKKQADVIDVGYSLYHRYPVKSEKLEKNWNEIFSEMGIAVEVESRINRIYNIKQPVGYEEEGK